MTSAPTQAGDANALVASAPGKMLLCGEYAVLEGAQAVVTSVGARARVFHSPEVLREGAIPDHLNTSEAAKPGALLPLPAEVKATRQAFSEEHGDATGGLRLDVRALRAEGQKLGLGSSAAASVATAAVLLSRQGLFRGDENSRRQAMGFALRGHRSVAPSGSGADVVASALGQTVAFRRQDASLLGSGAGTALAAETLSWPHGLTLRIVWTGKQVRTSDFLSKVKHWALSDSKAYQNVVSQMKHTSRSFAEGFSAGNVAVVIESAATYGEAMGALGRLAGVPIVDEKLTELAKLATSMGGACKPSGAGGGDVASAFFANEEAALEFERACVSSGFAIVEMPVHVEGVRIEPT